MVRAVRNHITSSSTDEAQASTSGATTYKTSSEAPTTLQPKEKGSSVDELILSDIVKAPSKQADAPQHASESDEALDPAATQPIFTPHGKWAFAAGKDIEDVTRLALVGSGSSCEVYWKTGRIEGRSITYLSKIWDASALSNPQTGIYAELAAYKGTKYLKKLQGQVIPAIINVLWQPQAMCIAMEPPHPVFWTEASATMVDALKERCIHAFEKIHAQGVLHGDVELRHMLIGADGRVTIIDFQNCRTTHPVPDLALYEATPDDFALEMRKVKFKLDYSGAREKERRKRQEFDERRKRNKLRREMMRRKQVGESVGDISPIEDSVEDKREPRVSTEDWRNWNLGLDFEPRQFTAPGLSAEARKAAVDQLASLVRSMEIERIRAANNPTFVASHNSPLPLPHTPVPTLDGNSSASLPDGSTITPASGPDMVIPCDLSAPIPSISSKSLLAPPVTPVSSPSHAYSLRKRKGLDTSDTNSGPAQRRKRLRTHASASPAVYTTPLPRQKYNANPVERTRLSTLPVNPDTDMEANPSTASGSPQADHVPLTIQTAESLPFSTPALTMSIAECSEAATPRRRLAGQRASGFQSPQHMQPSMSLEVPPPGDSPPGSPTIDAFSTENPEDEFTVPDWIPPEVRRQIYGSDASVLKVSNPSTPTHATSNVAARLGSSAEASPKKSHAMPSQGHANTSQTKPNLQMARFMALYHASVRPDLKHPSNERRLLPVLHDLETPPPYCYPLVTPFPTLRSVADSVKAISRVPDITVAEAGAFSQDDVPPPPSKIRDFAYEKYDGPRGYYVPHPPTAILAGRMREAHVAQQNIAKFVAAGFPHPSIVDTFEMEPARRNEYNVLTQHWRRTTKNIPCSWGKFKRSYEDAMNGLEDARIQSRIKRQKYGEAKAQNEYLSASCDEEYLLELKSRMTETELPHLADGPPILTLAQLDARQSSAVRPSSSSTQRRSALRTTPPAKAMPFTYLDNWTRSDFDISPRLGPSDEEIDRALFPVLAGEILKGVDTPGDLVELEAIEALNTRESWDVPGGASNAMDIDSSEDEYDDDEDADWDTDWDTYFDDHRGKPAVTSPVEPSISYPSLRTECEEADVPEFTGSSSIEAESAEDPMVGSPSPPPSSSSRLRPWSSLFSIFW